jgi:hypothetical protein
VDETYKGTQRTVLDLVQLGGTVGKVKVTVDGALGWQVGEEVLVFAEPYDASNYQVSGFSQGKFRITRNPVTGTACVDAPPLEGLSLRGAPSPQVPSGGRLKQSPTLDEFVSHALGSSDVPGDER